MSCPHDILDDSLSIRRVDLVSAEVDHAFKSKKMGKSRNFNRMRGGVRKLVGQATLPDLFFLYYRAFRKVPGEEQVRKGGLPRSHGLFAM